MKLQKLTASAVLISIGILSTHLIYIPIGASKCFPVQHTINVLAAVLLGPWHGVAIAFSISWIRNLMGTGSILAFPGSMVGAFLAGVAYRQMNIILAAMAGEIIGTGFFGGLIAWVLASSLLQSNLTAWFFIPPFLISTIGGSIMAGLLLKSRLLQQVLIGRIK
ncbi:MAG: energy coupling factor transporter S component ThiW [Phascolarctobacterium sp.]|nr:energy coupling factor transporter S component ThiW [Phascolarctobacterium sp.]